MNERINELSDIAYAKYLTNNPNSSFGRRSDYDKMFAELIIVECIDTMYKHGETYAHPSAGFYQAETFSEAIIEHFGVKE